jgi:hypothetical protein
LAQAYVSRAQAAGSFLVQAHEIVQFVRRDRACLSFYTGSVR